jgi:methyl-accepting chemotaxis protein
MGPPEGAPRPENNVKLPHLSIATKLYAIFALLATVTVGLAAVAVVNAERHEALTEQFGAAFRGGQNIERINGLIYALVMETRAIYLAGDATVAEEHAQAIGRFNERLGEALTGWQQSLHPDDTERFREIAGRAHGPGLRPGDRQAAVRGRAQGGAPNGEL